jgi:ribonuclease HIII
MSTDATSAHIDSKFRVESVEKSDPPEGMPDGDWHRYVVGHGESKIEGYKSGSLVAVTHHAEAFAEDLNARAARGYSVYAGRKRK